MLQASDVDENNGYGASRRAMVTDQLLARDIRDPRVLEAMQTVPRHRFVPPAYRHKAYSDGPLPIGKNQTISQPYIVALMTQLLKLRGDEAVLEVGTGSGYQAAVLARLARKVHTIERHRQLAQRAKRVLAELNVANVEVHVGDGSLGLPEHAPYEAIIVTAAAPRVPSPLMAQLADGGRLVIPVGGVSGQRLQRWVRRGQDYSHEEITPVAFVPLRGRYGWEEDEWSIE